MSTPNQKNIEIALAGESGQQAVSPVLLAEIFQSYEEAVVVADVNRRIVYVNSAVENLFGYNKEDLYGKETKVLYAEERDYAEQGNKRFNVDSRKGPENYRIVYRRADGREFLGKTTGAVMRNMDDQVSGFMGVIRPARSAEQSLDALQKVNTITANVKLSHEEKLDALLRVGLNHFGLEIGIVSHIEDSKYTVDSCVDYNEQLEPLTVFDLSGTYCVHTLTEGKPVGFHYVRESEIKDHPCYQNFQLESYIGCPIMFDDKVYGTLNFSSPSPVEPFNKDDYILIELLADTVSYLLFKKLAEEEMAALARIDELTGLPNRRATWERLTENIEQASRTGLPLSVLSIDIDHFKNINDTWGHAGGDLALVAFARVANQVGRKVDFCGRIGGEEFVFVLPGADKAAAQEFGNRLRERLADVQVEVADKEPIRLTLSAGIAKLEPGDTIESLLARADDAMYQAKEQGRDRVCL
ncbi:sensor domain-containing diguanylate cyclase [Aliidiomarina taiwanensis]|uniref:diguanylate cyclase n=1 Tax=Aliidiomarina taiwanensis TaxID=946228 RepID=A0A432XAQ6_9GAMM|nr:diguanylate cyclase [Aliidiomarina taiwanensis]RUO44439.1 sensor domain-containing diguanylate cyclase [Aliidiomarina taiwanensis]